jgi:hypothetical protein
MEEWLKHTVEDPIPNISRLVKRYKDYSIWINNYLSGDPIPPEYLALWDDSTLEFARVLDHDFGKGAIDIAKLILALNGEYKIEVTVK